MMIFAIVAVDENWGIGNKGKLLFSIPEDMKMFRRITEGKTVIIITHDIAEAIYQIN